MGPLSWSYGPYQYDPAGNITAIGAQYYVYDPMSRLMKASTAFTPAQQVQDFAYDVYGNLTQMKTDGVPVSTMSVDPTTNRVTTLTYDAAGNVTSWQPEGSAYPRDYTYDVLNRVVEEQVPNNPDVAYHVYTASDERYWTYSLHGGVAESHFKIRGMGAEVLCDFQLTGSTWTVFRDYAYRDGTLLASIAATGAQHISVDHLGSPRLVTDDARYRIGAHTYLPYGSEWTDGTAQEGDVLKFTGHERDRSFVGSESNGLDYMHARFYTSGTGRFLSPDPVLGNLLQPRNWNRYAYVLNNPIDFVDPFGLAERKPGEEIEEGDTCDGKIVDGWCTGETITVEAKAPSIDCVSMSAGFGDGIIGTTSFGLVSGHDLRKLAGADQVVDRCSQEYLGGRVGGTVVTLAAYAYGGIPATLTHFTTRGGAAAIQARGTVLPSTGLTCSETACTRRRVVGYWFPRRQPCLYGLGARVRAHGSKRCISKAK